MPPPDRSELTRALVVNAATKPANVVIAAMVAVAAFVLGQIWLLPVAAATYAALGVQTFFDEQEAEAVGQRRRGALPSVPEPRVDTASLAPEIARRVQAARREAAGIREAIASSEGSFSDVAGEVDELMPAIDTIARRAQRLHDYVAGTDLADLDRRLAEARGRAEGDPAQAQLVTALADQRATVERMGALLDRFGAELDQAVATLAVLRGEVVRLGVEGEAYGEERLAGRVRTLRDEVGAASDAMAELAARA